MTAVFQCAPLSLREKKILHLFHVGVDMTSERTVSASVHLFSPRPSKCIIYTFVLYMKCYCDRVVLEN